MNNKINNLVKKKLTVVTTFTGIGCQERGIQNTGLFDMDVLATCEMDINAIIAYAAIHNNMTPEIVDNYTDYPLRENMAKELTAMNIGYDFQKSKPYDWAKVARSKDKNKLLQKTWLACKLNKNVGDITKVDTFPQCDLFTWSFPCTDLSVAGKQEGMIKGKTRSGLVYEVLRILWNMKATNTLPKFLLMENVDALINKKNKSQYEEINRELDEIGYNCTYDVLNTKYTGIPQNRSRVFALYSLKSIDLSDFEFPKPFDNGIRLKDVLEDEVDDKYYIDNDRSQKLIDDLMLNGTLSVDGEPTEISLPSIYKCPDKRSAPVVADKVGIDLFIGGQELCQLQTALEQDMTVVSAIDKWREPAYLKSQCSDFERFADIACALMARDYKGFGNQRFNGVIEWKLC